MTKKMTRFPLPRAPAGEAVRLEPEGSDRREVWALLLDTNAREVARATRTLHENLVDGLRHFSAVRRAVPLCHAEEAHRSIVASERAVDPTEVFSSTPPRKWRRKRR